LRSICPWSKDAITGAKDAIRRYSKDPAPESDAALKVSSSPRAASSTRVGTLFA
jgi:hypothetical protein